MLRVNEVFLAVIIPDAYTGCQKIPFKSAVSVNDEDKKPQCVHSAIMCKNVFKSSARAYMRLQQSQLVIVVYEYMSHLVFLVKKPLFVS